MPQKSGQVSHHQISGDEAGQRLDNFLLRVWKGVPRSHVYRLLRSGQVRVNGGRAKPTRRLAEGDKVRLPPVRFAEREQQKRAPDALLERLESAITYESAELLVINKPANLAVHGGSGQAYGLIECCRQLREGRLELAHRLDRETSGLLMMAKTRDALLALNEALRDGKIGKRYVTLVQGDWQAPATVSAALRPQRQGGEHGMQVSADGKQSSTGFEVLDRLGEASLMRAELHTGRMHQIRVHAASVGHPVAGDRRYGNRDFNNLMKKHGLRRLFLHAEALHIPDSVFGDALQVKAPLPTDLADVVTSLSGAQA